MMNFDAIIFDCDGVLVDSEILSIRGERRVLKEHGLNYELDEFVRRFVGLHDEAFYAALRDDYRSVHKRDAPDGFEEAVLDGRRQEMHALTIIHGADKALQSHSTIAVASSSRAHFLEAKLKRMNLWEFAAPHVYSADLVPHGKPAPDIFRYTAKKLGVAANKCLVIEDSVNGVNAGHAAGMTVWGFTGGGHCSDAHGDRLLTAGASRVAQDFDQFMEWL